MIRALIFDCFGVLLDVYSQRRDPDVFMIVQTAKKKYKTAVLSNMSASGLADRLPDAATYFEVAVASESVGMAKPDPEIFILVADKLGVMPEECIMIDDAEAHCQGARAAGMQAIHFQNAAQLKQQLEKLL